MRAKKARRVTLTTGVCVGGDDPATPAPEADASNTVQTVQTAGLAAKPTEGSREPYIELAPSSGGGYHWIIYAGNDRRLATDATDEGFADKTAAQASIDSLRRILEARLPIVVAHKA